MRGKFVAVEFRMVITKVVELYRKLIMLASSPCTR